MTTKPDTTAKNAAIWDLVRSLYTDGRTPRQIAHKTGLLPSAIAARAALEDWPAPPPIDWQCVRDAWEGGKSDRAVALQYGLSAATVRKRRGRENWSRCSARGIDALRRAVNALSEALDQTPLDDTVATSRLATALSMAAGRLRVAEKHLLGKSSGKTDAKDALDMDTETEAMREQLLANLNRLAKPEAESPKGD